nr:exosome complex component RRP41-like protein [Cryptomonas sp.]
MSQKMAENDYFSQIRRGDGRNTNEIRNIKFRLNVIPSSQGSLFFETGLSKNLISIFGPLDNNRETPNQKISDFCFFRIQILSIKSSNENKYVNRFFTIINRIIQEILVTTFIQNTYYNVIIRVLENDGNFLSQVLNALSLICLMSGLPTKSLIGCCTTGNSNARFYTDLTADETFFLSTSMFLALQNDCENKSILLETKKILNFFLLEKSIQNAVGGCIQFQLLRFSTNRYFFSYYTSK